MTAPPTMMFCFNCKHWDSNDDADLAECLASVDLVSGAYLARPCHIMREPGQQCGPEARMFEAKTGTPPIPEPAPSRPNAYVVYADYGTYEGCQAPAAAFTSEAAAALYIVKTSEYWKDNAKIATLELDPAPATASAKP